jgi:hypothetical protein
MKTKRLVDVRLWKSSQAWHYQSVWKVGPWVVRVDILRDAYDAQSHLRVEMLTTLGWKELVSKPMTKDGADCYSVSYAAEAKGSHFVDDEAALVDEANIILSAMEGREE